MATTFDFHPACLAFPALTGANFAELVKSVKDDGLLYPIILHDGKILDGRNRYLACQKTGVEPRFEVYSGDKTPEAFAFIANIARRHLSKAEKALAASKLATMPCGGHRAAQSKIGAALTQEEAAKIAGIKKRDIEDARAVAETAHKPLIDAVKAEEMSLSVGAVLSRDKPLMADVKSGKVALNDAVKVTRNNRSARTAAASFKRANGSQTKTMAANHPAKASKAPPVETIPNVTTIEARFNRQVETLRGLLVKSAKDAKSIMAALDKIVDDLAATKH